MHIVRQLSAAPKIQRNKIIFFQKTPMETHLVTLTPALSAFPCLWPFYPGRVENLIWQKKIKINFFLVRMNHKQYWSIKHRGGRVLISTLSGSKMQKCVKILQSLRCQKFNFQGSNLDMTKKSKSYSSLQNKTRNRRNSLRLARIKKFLFLRFYYF